ncbi:helix-turn-helix domain-containing protein [Nocardia sp. NPDC020380]|uniref:helix-turn-helix domain-containing protein n=1 Tax=Nocardia sp. NPDC020380 TaxID=3364309 RepID=UPI003796BF6B
MEHNGITFVTIGQSADMLHCTPRTVHRHIRNGKLRAYKFGTRRTLVRLEDLAALIKVCGR